MTKIKPIFELLFKNIVIILLAAVVCVVLSVGYVTMYSEPTYSATAKVLVHNGNLNEINANENYETKISANETCLEIFNSEDMFVFLLNSTFSDTEYTVAELQSMIKVTAEGENSLVYYVTATSDNPEEAVSLIVRYSGMMYSYISQFVNRASVITLYKDSTASPVRTNVILIVLVGFVAGILLSSAAVIVLSLSNRHLKNAKDYKSRYSLRLLGVVPDFDSKERGKDK